MKYYSIILGKLNMPQCMVVFIVKDSDVRS